MLSLSSCFLGTVLLAADAPAPTLARGREVYEANCEECHGNKGRGDGDKARRLRFEPRDLSRSAFKCRCTASGELPTDADLVRAVTRGLGGTPMVGFAGTLSGDDIAAVVGYLKTLSPRFAAEAAPECIPVPDPPVASGAAAVDEGRQIFRLLECWRCHGREGEGNGPSAAGLKDDFGRKSKATRFRAGSGLKCGKEPRDLYRTLHTGINGSPMPSYDTALLYAREAGRDLRAVEGEYGAAAAEALAAYLAGEPDAAALAALTPGARRGLVEKRTWSLVAYLVSLLETSAEAR